MAGISDIPMPRRLPNQSADWFAMTLGEGKYSGGERYAERGILGNPDI